MRKKAEPRTQQHPKTSRVEASEVGLIVQGKNVGQSDRETCALDNRSHRTLQGKWRRALAPDLPLG
jgi:hypothetical protein